MMCLGFVQVLLMIHFSRLEPTFWRRKSPNLKILFSLLTLQLSTKSNFVEQFVLNVFLEFTNKGIYPYVAKFFRG